MAKVYLTNNNYSSDVVKVFRVEYDTWADLNVYVTDNQYEAQRKDEVWYYEQSEYEATVKACWVDSEYDADIKVYFVDRESSAGWTSNGYNNRYRNRLW